MIVVTCRDRLTHLLQTLPGMLQHDEVVLVDWNCPMRCSAEAIRWNDKSPHKVHTVRDARALSFHKTAALNLGARTAASLGSKHLLFLDADTLIADHAAFEDWYREALRDEEHFHVCLRPPGHTRNWDLTGVLLCTMEQFQQTEGYDEGIRGWGMEDIEMRLRLGVKVGLPWKDIPDHIFRAIQHSDVLRTRHYSRKNKQESNIHNAHRLKQNIRRWTGKELKNLDRRYRPLLSTPGG